MPMHQAPDYEQAAIKAAETLIKHRISAAPVLAMPILKTMRGVLVLSFDEMAETVGTAREDIVTLFGEENQDAVTIVQPGNGTLRYVVAYNQRLPVYLLQRALARELGHIVLHHDGSRPEEVRLAEAQCFARHLICPRPVIHAVQASGIPITVELIGSVTGCYKRCIEGMQKTPGAHVPPELNRIIKEQFADYIDNFLSYARIVKNDDHSERADFGTYMDNYEE